MRPLAAAVLSLSLSLPAYAEPAYRLATPEVREAIEEAYAEADPRGLHPWWRAELYLICKRESRCGRDGLVGSWPTPYPSYQAALDDLRMRFPRESNVRYFLESLVETVDGYDFLFSQHALSAIDACYRGWHPLLRQIKCPLMLMRADNSWYLTKEESATMLTTLPSTSFVEITGSDHMVYADNPDQFYPLFEQFLMTHTGNAS